MEDLQAPLRDDVRLLGQLLGNTISKDKGPEFLEKVELIRTRSKAARSGKGSQQELLDALRELERRRAGAYGAGLQPVFKFGQLSGGISPRPTPPQYGGE